MKDMYFLKGYKRNKKAGTLNIVQDVLFADTKTEAIKNIKETYGSSIKILSLVELEELVYLDDQKKDQSTGKLYNYLEIVKMLTQEKPAI